MASDRDTHSLAEVRAAIALNRVAHDLVPGIRHDFGLVARNALEAAGFVIVEARAEPDAGALRAALEQVEDLLHQHWSNADDWDEIVMHPMSGEHPRGIGHTYIGRAVQIIRAALASDTGGSSKPEAGKP